MAATFTWTQGSPDQIADVLRALARQAPNVVNDIATSEASRAEAWMKENAPWTDRTGNARQGLFGRSERSGNVITVTLGGTMDYIPYLELGTYRMTPRRVIIPAHRLWRFVLPEQVGLGLMELFAP